MIDAEPGELYLSRLDAGYGDIRHDPVRNVLFIVLNFWVSKLVGEESGVGTQNGEERRNLFP